MGKEDEKELKPLTPKEQRFCEEYVIDLNATQAAIRAGYSEDSARSIASNKLTKHNIQEAVKDLRGEISKRCKITIDEIVTELAEQFRVDPNEVFDNTGALKLLGNMTDRARRSIKSIQRQTFTTEGGVSEKIKTELYDKHTAAEKLMRHLGGYGKDHEQANKPIVITGIDINRTGEASSSE